MPPTESSPSRKRWHAVLAILVTAMAVAVSACQPLPSDSAPSDPSPGLDDDGVPAPRVVDFATLLCRNDPIVCRPLVLPVATIDDARRVEAPPALPLFVPPLPLPRRPNRLPDLILGDGTRLSPVEEGN